MKIPHHIAATFALATGGAILASEPLFPRVSLDSAPPVPPPVQVAPSSSAEPPLVAAATTPYSIGEPTPEEQLYVELINRARADAVAESLLFFNTTDPGILSAYNTYSVDLTMMLAEFAVLPPVPPLALNPQLTAAARRHTQDMFDNVFQGHEGTDGTFAWDRVDDTGYDWSTIGENVYSSAKSVFYGHAGFEVDWGPGPGGMQTGRGHRTSIHNGSFSEIGVGVILDSNQAGNETVGPQLVTQVFAIAHDATPFITGVVYYDLNGNNFYDIGEGIGGVRVEATGTARAAVTALSGGYALPVTANGGYTVTFSGAGFTPDTQVVTIANSQNVKVDFTPEYNPPAITGDLTPALGQANAYTFAAVPGAAEHEWRSFQKTLPAPEGAEDGSARVTIEQSAGYDVFESTVAASGQFSFHLAHPSPPIPQIITLNGSFLAGSNATLAFQSRLGLAADDQHAQVQVSADDGTSWQVVYNQDGTGGQGETTFTTRSVDLSEFDGKTIRLRFVYDFQGGSFFNQIDPMVGWLIDDITFAGLEEIANVQAATAASGTFQFQPGALGPYGLQVRARTGHEFLPWGPIYEVEAVEGSAEARFRVGSIERVGGDLHLQLEVTAGNVLSTDLVVESKATLDDPWAPAQAAIEAGLLIVIPNPGTQTHFYRVRKN